MNQEYAYKPTDELTGALGAGVAQSLPSLVNPYGSTGANLASVLGGGLLAGLFGYSARKEAERKNAEMLPVMMDLMSARDTGAISNVLKTSPYGERLAPIGLQRMTALEEAQAQTLSDEAKFQRQLNLIEAKEKAKAKYRAPEKADEKKDWFVSMPVQMQTGISTMTGVSKELQQLAKKFNDLNMTAAEFNVQAKIPGSDAFLIQKRALTLVPQGVRAMGEVGALTDVEQENAKKNLLGDITSGTESIGKLLLNFDDQIRTISSAKANSFKTAYEQGGDALLAELQRQQPVPKPKPSSTPTPSPLPSPGLTMPKREDYKTDDEFEAALDRILAL
jgi:hypothetical protein